VHHLCLAFPGHQSRHVDEAHKHLDAPADGASTMAKKRNARKTTNKAPVTREVARGENAGTNRTDESKARVAFTDPRLPLPGTRLEKRDRHGAVRCECTVEVEGIHYAGAVYGSLSGAAIAAAKDLGLQNKTQNGFAFWGITKPSRRPVDAMAALDRAWTRYHDQVAHLVRPGIADENRAKIVEVIGGHVQALDSLRSQVA
jgi:hypothetical protein